MGWCAEVSLLQTQCKNFGAVYVDQNIEAQRSTRFCYNEFTQFASRGIYESPLCSEKTEASQLHCAGLIDVCAVIARLQVALLQAPFFPLVLSFHSEACCFQMTFHTHRLRLQRPEQIVPFVKLKNALLGLHCVIKLTTMLITKKKRYKLRYLLKQWCFVKNNLIIYRVIVLQIFAFMNNCAQVVVWTC